VCKKEIKNWKKYCSRKCYYTTVSAKTRGEKNAMWMGGSVERSCRVCTKTFFVKQGILKRKNGGSFCSNKCLGISRSGSNSPHWRGNNVGYNGIHHWIKKNYGKSNMCENEYCPKISRGYHWANISNKYLRDRKDWLQLCVSCHKVFDCKKLRFKVKK